MTDTRASAPLRNYRGRGVGYGVILHRLSPKRGRPPLKPTRTLDFFAIPLPGFEDQIFVINDMTIIAEAISSQLTITFHGSVEWALDQPVQPTCSGSRARINCGKCSRNGCQAKRSRLLVFSTTRLGYRCDIHYRGQKLRFEEFDPGETYAAALLNVLSNI